MDWIIGLQKAIDYIEDNTCIQYSLWLPSSGYELADAPEISVYHWFFKHGDLEMNNSRYIELWIPITKCE